jgi:hypothetical protein
MPMVDRLTPLVESIILEAMRRGATYRVAGLAAGVSQQTIFHWLRQGRRSKSGKFVKFLKSLRQVQAQALAACAARVLEAVDAGDVKAAQWFLERRAPEDYGPFPIKDIERRLKALEKTYETYRGLAGTAGGPRQNGEDAHDAASSAGRPPHGR